MKRLIDKFIFALAALFLFGAGFALIAVITGNIREKEGFISIIPCLALSGLFFGLYRIIGLLEGKNK